MHDIFLSLYIQLNFYTKLLFLCNGTLLHGYVVLTKLSRFSVLIGAFCTLPFLFHLQMLFWDWQLKESA